MKTTKTKKESLTKDRLLDAAQQLMMAKGYVATTVDEICAEAKVTKGSFFHYFKNKEDLGKTLLTRFAEMQHQMIQEAVRAASEDPLERIYAFIDFGIKMSKEKGTKGCLVGTFAQEISETHPELRDICKESFSGFCDMIREDLVRARQAYPPKIDFDVNSLAEHFLAVIQGSLIIVKAKQDKKIFEKNLLHLKTYVQSLFGK